MKRKILLGIISIYSLSLFAATTKDQALNDEIQSLQKQTRRLQNQINQLQNRAMIQASQHDTEDKRDKGSKNKIKESGAKKKKPETSGSYQTSAVTVHQIDSDPDSLAFYPTALMAHEHVITYIAGTPVITSPFLGSRPTFDGSDLIVNVPSINRDIRLMQQRRSLYRAYDRIGYPAPEVPLLAISGKVEPVALIGDPFLQQRSGDLTLGSGELDLAAILNKRVEAYMALAFDTSPPDVGGQRVTNSWVFLNMGFVNIGNLDESPFYFTGGQLYVPFGRFATGMVSAPLTMMLARTKSRPFIFGYKSQHDSGPFAAVYGYRSDTTLGGSGTGGVNLGYVHDNGDSSGEIGVSGISSMNDSGGMQLTGSQPFTTFGGFASITNGNENVHQIPAIGVHAHYSVDRYNFVAEWVSATTHFREQDLSFNGKGALPQAGQLEAGITFTNFDKPASLNFGYQWSKQALALNLPEQRVSGTYNISIWKDTVESLEYRHDMNYGKNQYANGAAPVGLSNLNTYGPGGASDTLLMQIGVYF